MDSLKENLLIYNNNLSVYYLGSTFITVLSVVLAWLYQKYCVKNISLDVDLNEETDEVKSSNIISEEWDKGPEVDATGKLGIDIISQIIMRRQSALVEEVAANLTEEQLKEEKEVERQQLEAIFQLLQNQQDKYQVSSMEELQDQLRLYRH